jgi:hypothetical protein
MQSQREKSNHAEAGGSPTAVFRLNYGSLIPSKIMPSPFIGL